MKHVKPILLSLASVGILALTGCARRPSGGGTCSTTVEITIWEDQTNIEMIKPIAEEFVNKHKKAYPSAPEINITFAEQTEKSAVEKMLTNNPTGHGPDIAAVTHDTIISAADAGVIAPIMYEEEMKSLMSEDALNAVATVAKSGAKTLYGYPITAESQVVFFDNTAVTAEELSSFDSFAKTNKKLAIKETNADCSFYNFGLLTDSVLFGEDGTDKKSVNLQTPKAIENIVTFYHDYHSSVLDLSPEDAVSSLLDGTVAGMVSSPFMYQTLKQKLGDKLGIAKLPTINGVSERPFSGYKSYVVNSYSKYPEIANAIAAYLVNPDAQWIRLDEACYYPSLSEEAMTDDLKETIEGSEEATVFGESLADSRRMPSIGAMANFWSISQAVFGDFWTNGRGSLTEAQVKSGLAQIEAKLKA
ncbi:MAG: extracellular solute-binding protein [Bacilli bacterium]|nr:extracellular solute-binding protein [Bacilli bacterium]